MNTHDNDDIFAKRAREVFIASIAGLDHILLQRLAEARRVALDAARTPAPLRAMRPWALPAGALTALAVAVVAGVLWSNGPQSPQTPPFAPNGGEDSGLLLASDNLDMYSDLDFYRWLATEDQKQAAKPNPDADTDEDDTDQGDDGDTGR